MGSYRDDLKHGMGKLIFDGKCSFTGYFEEDVVEGLGKQKGEDYEYEGPWLNNDMQGAARVTYLNSDGKPGDKYIG